MGFGRRSGEQDEAIVVLRSVALAATPPVVALLLAGLVAANRDQLATDVDSAAAVDVLPLHDLASPGMLLTPLDALTAGLLLLAAVPSVTVFLVTLTHLRGRRWPEAGIAAGVLAILALSVAVRAHR